MSITSFRAVEPLYIVILRNTNQAEALFKSWIKSNRVEHANVSGNKMMLHDQRGFEQFFSEKLEFNFLQRKSASAAALQRVSHDKCYDLSFYFVVVLLV